MLNDFSCSCPVYIACGYTDLRRGIDGLATLVKSQFQMDPFQRALFLFCGRRRDRIKALYWEGDGFLLLYKRLESGSFQWPRSTEEVQALTPQQYGYCARQSTPAPGQVPRRGRRQVRFHLDSCRFAGQEVLFCSGSEGWCR